MSNFKDSELIIRNFPGYISWFDENLNYLGLNKGLEELIGVKFEEIKGKKLGTILKDKNSKLMQDFCEFVSSNLNIKKEDYEIYVNGKKIFVHTHFLKLENGKINLIVSEDYSEKMLLNEILLKQKEMSNTNLRLAALGEMVSSIAHEINNPMTIISGMLNRIEKNILEKDKQSLAKINTQIKRITAIISSLKLISEKVSDQTFQLASLNKILKNVEVAVYDKIQLNQINLQFEYQDEVFIECIEEQIEQVFLGMLCNSVDAIKFLKERWINVKIESEKEMVKIRFIDSGHGIPDSIKDKIMEPFFTTKEVGKGIGLGLSISRRIVELHGGHFYLSSQSSNTEFVVEFKKNISFDVAIKSHLEWKIRLEKYMLNPNGEFDYEAVCKDNRCRLGRWIYSEESRLGRSIQWVTLKDKHKKFHQLAGEIVKSKCQIGSETHKSFELVSEETIEAIVKLKDKVSGVWEV